METDRPDVTIPGSPLAPLPTSLSPLEETALPAEGPLPQSSEQQEQQSQGVAAPEAHRQTFVEVLADVANSGRYACQNFEISAIDLYKGFKNKAYRLEQERPLTLLAFVGLAGAVLGVMARMRGVRRV